MGAFASVFVLFLQIFFLFYTGYTAWQWTEPESFVGVIGFLILWSILEFTAHVLLGLFVGSIVAYVEENNHHHH
jgi:hypothetical protein